METLVKTTLSVKSPAFEPDSLIPMKYSCHGENINPELYIGNLPDKTRSIALIVDDPDAPGGTYDHWIMWNIPVTDTIEEDSSPGIEGLNSKKELKYTGPCPPQGKPHHYYFKVYALDRALDLPAYSDKEALLEAMKNHIVDYGELVGIFQAKNK